MNNEDQTLVVSFLLSVCAVLLSIAVAMWYTDKRMSEHNAQYEPSTNAIILQQDHLK